MTVLGGLNLDITAVPGPGIALGQAGGGEGGFTQILAALDPAMAPPAAAVGAPMILTRTGDPVATLAANDEADAEDAEAVPEARAPGEAAVPQPFVAPPIAIGVSSAAPVDPQPVPVAERVETPASMSGTHALRAARPRTELAETDILSPADEGASDAVEIAPAIVLPARARPHTAPAPLVSMAADAVVPVATPRTTAPANPAIESAPAPADPPVVLTRPEAPVVPVLTATEPDASFELTSAPTAPDTAQQLGAEAVATRLDIANEAEMIDRLARDIAQLSGAEGRLKFQLNPEHLGALHVEVEQRAEGVSLRFGTESEGARQVIVDAQQRLVTEARAQGVRVAETHVDLNSPHQQQGGSRGQQPSPSPIVITRGEAADAAPAEQRPRTIAADRFA